jgi:hypothetical protein
MVRVGEEALLPLAQGEGAVEGEVRALGLKVEELARLSVARGMPLPLVLPLRVPDANVETLAAKLALPVPVAAPLVRALPQALAVRVAVNAVVREGEPPPEGLPQALGAPLSVAATEPLRAPLPPPLRRLLVGRHASIRRDAACVERAGSQCMLTKRVMAWTSVSDAVRPPSIKVASDLSGSSVKSKHEGGQRRKSTKAACGTLVGACAEPPAVGADAAVSARATLVRAASRSW